MITIDCKKFIMSLDKKPVKTEGKDTTVGMILAQVVLAPHSPKKGFRPLRSWELAQKFYDNNKVDLEESEVIQIKELLEDENQPQLPFVVAQVLLAISEAEEKAKNTNSTNKKK